MKFVKFRVFDHFREIPGFLGNLDMILLCPETEKIRVFGVFEWSETDRQKGSSFVKKWSSPDLKVDFVKNVSTRLTRFLLFFVIS